MQKLFYLLFDDANADGTKLRESLCKTAVPALRSAGAMDISVFGDDEDVAAGSPVRRSDPPIRAMVSFWMHDAADRGSAEDALAALTKGMAGYLVLESRPMTHARPIGRRAEGMTQMTCIKKRSELSQEEFIRIWHDEHREVATETQSTFGYVRNEIIRVLTPGAPAEWSAIVEESFPLAALDDPKIFFDSKTQQEYETNLKRMLESCDRFLRLESVEVTFLSEYYFG